MQNYIFVPLDNFRDYVHNKGVNNLSRLDAWLLFLSTDDPEKIYLLLETYPEFRPLYEQIFDICQNTGRMMEMFSRELQMMDHNTVKLMIDDMKEEIQTQAEEIENARAELDAQLQEVEKRDKTIEALEKEVKRLKESLNR